MWGWALGVPFLLARYYSLENSNTCTPLPFPVFRVRIQPTSSMGDNEGEGEGFQMPFIERVGYGASEYIVRVAVGVRVRLEA